MANKIEVTIDIIIHATEDISKFYESFERIFGMGSESFSIQNLTGHFDNPITMLSAKVTKRDAIHFVEKFVSKMSPVEIKSIINDLDGLISSSGLHLRLDKQEFINGNIILRENNAIKMRIYAPVYNKKETTKIYQDLLKISN